jgi:hypothetical protein
VVFICSSLWLMVLSSFTYASWPFLYLLWRKVCSDPMSIF